ASRLTPSPCTTLAGRRPSPVLSISTAAPSKPSSSSTPGSGCSPSALATMSHTQKDPVQWLEPIWKMLWSNKALLAILWELNPNHELLLPAYLDGPREMSSYVRKPFFGREGQGIAVIRNGNVIEGAPGSGNAENCVY